jgi:hypothetical protein
MNKKSYSLNIPNNIVLKDLVYDNVFVVMNEEEMETENKSLILRQENSRIFISMNRSNDKDKDSSFIEMMDQNKLKLELNEFLKFNSMWVESIQTEENNLTILINKTNTEIPAAKIILIKSEQFTYPEIDITTSNLEDTNYLNELVSCLLLN